MALVLMSPRSCWCGSGHWLQKAWVEQCYSHGVCSWRWDEDRSGKLIINNSKCEEVKWRLQTGQTLISFKAWPLVTAALALADIAKLPSTTGHPRVLHRRYPSQCFSLPSTAENSHGSLLGEKKVQKKRLHMLHTSNAISGSAAPSIWSRIQM